MTEKPEEKTEKAKVTSNPHIAPIEDPEFAEVITGDLAVDAGEGLHMTRDPKKSREKQHSEPGIRLSELGVKDADKDDGEEQAEAASSDDQPLPEK